MKNWMIYGANGYTGRLMAVEAAHRGLKPVLAGRNKSEIESLAAELGLEHRVFGLQDLPQVITAIEGMHLVMHCAGPFSATSQPMIEACLLGHTHYLDITGEISVFENAWQQSDAAQKADIVLCPGAGFDVVPTDCLAATLVNQLPAAVSLQLAFEPAGGMSPGTAKTSIEGMGKGGMVRKDGKLLSVPLAWKTRRIPFRHAERQAMTIPWGDVFTAWVTTGIQDIEVYISVPPATVKRLRRLRMLQPLLGLKWLQNLLKRRIDKSLDGPSEAKRADTKTQLWGEVISADGRSVSATMETPNGYDLTVTAGLGIVEFLLANEVEGGYYTPSLLLGPGYAQTLPGVSLEINA